MISLYESLYGEGGNFIKGNLATSISSFDADMEFKIRFAKWHSSTIGKKVDRWSRRSEWQIATPIKGVGSKHGDKDGGIIQYYLQFLIVYNIAREMCEDMETT